jgi:hypothetical protein
VHRSSVTNFCQRPRTQTQLVAVADTDLAGNDLKSIHDLDVSAFTGLVHPVYCECIMLSICLQLAQRKRPDAERVLHCTSSAAARGPLTPSLPPLFWGVPGGGMGVCGGVRSANQLKVTRCKLFVYV